MIGNFAYVKAGSIAEAVKALNTKGARIHAGGTDLLGCMRDEIFAVEKVVSISGIQSLKSISPQSDGGLRIGALTTIADIAANPSIAAKYAALGQAAASVASPQLREQGTIGGNICQRPRCWYFRGNFPCARKGGTMCYAVEGENQYHAIFGSGPCFYVHPSDTAVALSAFQAVLTIAGSSGSRPLKMESFFADPGNDVLRENILAPNEIVTAITLPALTGNVRSHYRKIMTRGAWDFASASVAMVLQLEKDIVSRARVVLGGVGPFPWRAEAAEKALTGKKPDVAVAVAAGEAATTGAEALRDNAYKIDMVRGAVEETVLALA
jgi:xanthine dehydrogenase YagS FAD-binding subunit